MSNKLYLGVEQTIITPKVGTRLFGYAEDLFSNQVHDDLHATVFLFEQGDVSAVMVSIAVVALNESLANVIRKGVSEKTGIPTSNIMLASIPEYNPTASSQASSAHDSLRIPLANPTNAPIANNNNGNSSIAIATIFQSNAPAKTELLMFISPYYFIYKNYLLKLSFKETISLKTSFPLPSTHFL